MAGSWPSIRASLFSDLLHLCEAQDPVDIIALTGDISNRGAPGEYEQAHELIIELALKLEECTGVWPHLVCVPGNHDVRRDLLNKIEQKVLESGWDEDIKNGIFNDPNDPCRASLENAFAQYRAWVRARPCNMVEVQNKGILTGDFTATFEKDGKRLGFLGLNSSFRHVSDWAQEGFLSIPSIQIHKAAGGDLTHWCDSIDLGILLTHHPTNWLGNDREFYDTVLFENSPIRIHLCGHLHEPKHGIKQIATIQESFFHQAESLFGCEWYPNGKKRLHGYALLDIEVSDNARNIKMYPRTAGELDGGSWRFDRSTRFGLARGSDVSKIIVLSLDPAQRPRITTQASFGEESPTQKATATREPKRVDDAQLAVRSALATGTATLVLGEVFEDENGMTPLMNIKRQYLQMVALDMATNMDAPFDDLHTLAASKDRNQANSALSYFRTNASDRFTDTLVPLIGLPWRNVIAYNLFDLAELNSEDSRSLAAYHIIKPDREKFTLPRPNQQVLLTSQIGSSIAMIDSQSPYQSSHADRAKWDRFVEQTIVRTPVVIVTDDITQSHIAHVVEFAKVSRSEPAAQPAVIVCPSLDERTERLLDMHGIGWLQCSARELVDLMDPSRSSEVAVELTNAREQLMRRLLHPSDVLQLAVSEFRVRAADGSRDFLRGQEPTWGDVLNGFAVELSAVDDLERIVTTADNGSLVLMANTAGSGRSTALMQVALRLDASGYKVGWIESRTHQKVGRISALVEQVIENAFDIVIVDDADGYGDQSAELIRRIQNLASASRTVIIGCRSIKARLFQDMPGVRRFIDRDLGTKDVDKLVELLREKNVIPNRRLTDRELRDLLLVDSGRQLLVGMMQATSGKLFSERISSECRALDSSALAMYGAVCIVSAEGESITLDQALAAVELESDAIQAWSDFKRLRSAKLIRATQADVFFEARHRVIAETVVDYLRTHGFLGRVLKGTLAAFADAAHDTRDNSKPERRILTRLLSHTYMLRLDLPIEEVRAIYEYVEGPLNRDFHYWLQRGSYELEAQQGDLDRSREALMSARTLAGGESDKKVLTTYARVRLELASRSRSSEASVLGIEAVADLHRVVEIHGVNSPHTFVILCTTAVPWLCNADVARSEKLTLAEETMRYLTWPLANRLESENREFKNVRATAVNRIERLLVELA